MFFALLPTKSVLGDANIELIECYIEIRNNPEEVMCEIEKLLNTPEDYYRIRGDIPKTALGRAARLIYLTSLSFNGLYRQNQKGEFNVPYGGRTAKKLCNLEHLKKISEALFNSELLPYDFAETLSTANKGDLVYLDPPYTVAHGNNGFVKYNAKIFSWEDQVRLATLAHDLRQRDCHVVISNADHDSIRSLYKDFQVKTISRSSVIAASREKRGTVTECVFY